MKEEMRIEDVKSKLAELGDTLGVVHKHLPTDYKEFQESRLIKDAVYKEIEFCIELVIDICSIINADLRLGVPENEDNILDNLEKNKIFDSKTIEKIKEMKGFRNILVHKYGAVDDEQAFENISGGLSDFEEIIARIERFLEEGQEKSRANRS